jgi:oligopeptide/dipeptide ABC transporter ATP-binding protein
LNNSKNNILLEVRNLKTYFYTMDGVVPAVDGVDLRMREGETLGLVGESGCGKSVTALSIMRLISPPGKIIEGEIIFNGHNLLALKEEDMYNIRGNKISMIFQEPMTSLNPVFTIGDQIMEAIMIHQGLDKAAARQRAIEMLRLVGIPNPEQRVDSYPHEMSGGMRQRVMIAMALSCNPQLLIADEPTTALDVTIQAQILELMRSLKERTGLSILLITHDLGVIAEMAQEVAVMYVGRIVEQADVVTLYKAPKHPYTQGLMSSIPTLATGRDQRLNVIKGSVPSLYNLPPGCHFAPRCPFAFEKCRQEMPPLKGIGGAHLVRCWLYEEDWKRAETMASIAQPAGAA